MLVVYVDQHVGLDLVAIDIDVAPNVVLDPVSVQELNLNSHDVEIQLPVGVAYRFE